MKFVTVRELRNTSGEVWRRLAEEELVLTANGRPVGLLVGIDEGNLEATLRELRRARAAAAVSRMRESARVSGRSRMTRQEIEREIQVARRQR